MTELLLKIFVKDYKDTEKTAVRTAIGKLAGGVAITVNILLSLLKILSGVFLLGGSVSVIADGANNLSDAASGFISFAGFKMSEKPADEEHPYGHGRYEYLSGLMVALLIMVIGVELLKSGIEKIISPSQSDFSPVAVGVLVFSILTKFWLMFFNRNLAKRISSDTLKATSADSRNDVISTSAVLVATLITHFSSLDLDGYMGVAVALFILYSGFGLVKNTIDPLLGKAPSAEKVHEIKTKIMSYPSVLGTHDLMVHDYGPGRQFASVHVELSSEVDVLEGHDLIDRIEQDFLHEQGLHLVIHYDPICNSEALGAFRLWLQRKATEIDPSLSVHDLRMVPTAHHTNVIFDCVVPYSCPLSDSQVKSALIALISENYPAYRPVINIDKSYISSEGGQTPPADR